MQRAKSTPRKGMPQSALRRALHYNSATTTKHSASGSALPIRPARAPRRHGCSRERVFLKGSPGKPHAVAARFHSRACLWPRMMLLHRREALRHQTGPSKRAWNNAARSCFIGPVPVIFRRDSLRMIMSFYFADCAAHVKAAPRFVDPAYIAALNLQRRGTESNTLVLTLRR
eukprot:IDg7512t1